MQYIQLQTQAANDVPLPITGGLNLFIDALDSLAKGKDAQGNLHYVDITTLNLQSVLTKGNTADASILLIGNDKEITTQQVIGSVFFGASLKNDTINNTGFLRLANTFSDGRSGFSASNFKLVKNGTIDVVVNTPSISGTMALVENLGVIFNTQEVLTNDLFFNLKPIYRVLIGVPPSTISQEAFFVGGLPIGIETVIQAKHTVQVVSPNGNLIEFGATLDNSNSGGGAAVPIRATILNNNQVTLRTAAVFIGTQVIGGHIIVEYTKV